MKLKPIDDQVIVITGASSGIGLATAQAAADHGAHLVLSSRNEKALARITDVLHANGADAIYVVADVGDRAQVQHIADAAIAGFGRIDTWINDAGISIFGTIEEVSEKDARRLFDINFWGVVNGSLVALPYLMRNSGGALINLGSEVSDTVLSLQGYYSASKHAVKGFTDALRVEVERVLKMPVSITLIQPTAVNTPFPQHAKNYLDREPKLPSPQIDPFQVAEAILKAATEPTRNVTVGAMATLNTFMHKFVPAIAERMDAMQTNRQQFDMPPRDPDGALYRPGDDGCVHGPGTTRPL